MNMKERLISGEQVLGTMVTVFDNPDIVKMLKVVGFDFFIVDCEHGSFDYSKVAALLGMARAVDLPGLVRIPEVKREVVLKYMDAGAMGLLLPSCNTVEQARKLVEYAKYAPLGDRGVSLNRGHTEYKTIPSATEYMKKANEETILMIQVESPTSVSNIEDILAVDGVDVAFVGPNDLSQSMGIMGQTTHPDFIAALEKVIRAAKDRNKFAGIHLMVVEPLKGWMEKGMTFNLWANDVVMMMNCAKEGLKQLKQEM